MMGLMMLLTFFLGLLHLWTGVCDADVVDDDLLNPTTFIYTNPYPIAKPYDCRVIAALATKGQCMSYIGIERPPSESLASCELYCWETFYANTWDVSIHSVQAYLSTETWGARLPWVFWTLTALFTVHPARN